jgi:PKD repeat protein
MLIKTLYLPLAQFNIRFNKRNYLMKTLIYKVFILGLVFITNYSFLEAQISIGGTAPGIMFNLSDQDAEMHVLNRPDMAQIETEDHENERAGFPSPARMGVSVNAGLDTDNAGVWTTLPDGSLMWRLRIYIADALALGVYYDRFHLPDLGYLYLYNKDRNQQLGAYSSANNHESGLFATEFIQGDEVILEYHQTGNFDARPTISISDLAYAYRHIAFESREIDGTEVLWCMINVACSEGDGWEDQIRSVARISIRIGGSFFWCSGSLINNTLNNRDPYFLTAAHCGGNASTSDLNQWVFYFNYQASTCSGTGSGSNTIVGCQLRARDPSQSNNGSDFYLVRFNSNIPDGYNVYYSGWNRSNSNADMGNGVSIHHPAGSIKKISTYSTPLISANTWNGLPSHWMSVWAYTPNGRSIVEGGSSGSPIFDSNGLIVGDLTGGYESNTCESPSPAFYGKMWYSWDQNGTTPQTRLKDWLDPIDTGIIKLIGVNWQVQPPTADFEADSQNIEQGDLVNFTDLSGPGILSWYWEFEGGIPEYSTEQDPGPVLYTEVGLFAVSLTVTNADGEDSLTKTNYIEVAPTAPPTAEFTANHTQIVAGGTVSFSDLSEGSPFTWNWAFEGGSPASSSLQNPTIRFNQPGNYTVSLGVTNYGGTDMIVKENYITAIEAVLPQADFEASTTNINAGSTVDFTDVSSGEPFAWYWEFEGGLPSSSETQHPQAVLYQNAGAYNVSLTVANAFGQHTKTVEDYIIVDLVGIAETGKDNFRVFPNPGNGIITIESTVTHNRNINYSVISSSGKIIKQLNATNQNEPLLINLSDQVDGIYLLMIETGDQRFYRKITVSR